MLAKFIDFLLSLTKKVFNYYGITLTISMVSDYTYRIYKHYNDNNYKR